CDYHTPNYPNGGKWTSPPFTFSGAPPYVIEFDSWKDMNAKGDAAVLHVTDPALGVSSSGGPFANSSGIQPLSVTISNPGFWNLWDGKQVHLEFEVEADPQGNLGSGWRIDNVRVKNSGSLLAERPATGEAAEPEPANEKEKEKEKEKDEDKGDEDKGKDGLFSPFLGGWSGYPSLSLDFTRRDLRIDFSSEDSGSIPRTIPLLGARLKSW